jgi:hypothetical protein
MSSCSRCRQAHSTAKTNWNGDTAEVYVRGGRSSVGHYAVRSALALHDPLVRRLFPQEPDDVLRRVSRRRHDDPCT